MSLTQRSMNSFVLLSSAAFGLPVVQATAPETKLLSNEEAESKTRVKPSSLPLYPEAEKLEYTLQPPTKVENLVRDARTQAAKIKEEYQPGLDRVSHIINTGRAHTSEAIIRLREEDNLVGRIGFMTVGGLLGLIAGRKGRFLKKITYLSAGLAGTGSICYPKEAKVLAVDAGNLAAKNARIAYHFVIGTRPPIQNENGKAFEKMSNMVSDVWQWGFRLFDKKQPEVKVAEKSGPEKSLLAETEELPSQNNQDASPPLPSEPVEPAKTKEEADTDGVHSGETLIAAEPPVVITSDDQPVVEESSDTSRQATAEVPAEISFQPASAVTSESETSSDTDSGSTAKTGLKLEGDLGQGNPEDKELYTTRE